VMETPIFFVLSATEVNHRCALSAAAMEGKTTRRRSSPLRALSCDALEKLTCWNWGAELMWWGVLF